MHPVIPYIVGAALFAVGVYGVMVRRHAVLLLMAVELMLAGVNVILVTTDAGIRTSGQVFTALLIAIAAAEAGLGLAIMLRVYRDSKNIDVTAVDIDPAVGPLDGGEDPR